MMPDAARRHAELIERMERIIIALEHQSVTSERTNRHLAELSAKVEGALRFFVKAWQELKGSKGAPT